MDSFQVDIILSSLKELQEGKSRNEKVLAEEYAKRKQLETQLESAIAKQKTVAQKNAKMKEAMKVAEMKVAQTQAQVKMYEQVNDERKQRIAELKRQIEEQERERQTHLGTFESQMKDLTERLRTSWHEFGEHTLETSLTQHKAKKASLLNDVAMKTQYLQELTEQVAQSESDTVGGIPTITWKTALDMFKVENEAVKGMVERSRQSLRLDEVRVEHKTLTRKLEELEVKIINSTTSGNSKHHEE